MALDKAGFLKMNSTQNIPFYAKFALISIAIFSFVYTMYIGQQIILPLIYATLLAILLNPFVEFLIKHKTNRIIAITIVVTLAISILLVILYFIVTRISLLSEGYPLLKEKFDQTTNEVIKWTSQLFNIRISKINTWINETQTEALSGIGGVIGQTISVINNSLIVLVLIPVYLSMILYYKKLILEFIRQLFSSVHHIAVFEVLVDSKKIIQKYLVGLFLEAVIVAILNSVGLMMLGIQYAIILGIIGALLNIIPYIGGVVATLLPMLVAYITKDSSTSAFLVFLLYLAIQFIDNNLIIPSIVASKVKINAIVSVVVVLIGGAIWGVPGMFLSIPLTAVMKVIFDRIDPLKPWGFLMGTTEEYPRSKLEFINKHILKK